MTVDEVGDVTDLPLSPSPSVPMETTEEDAPTSVQKDIEGVHCVINHIKVSLCGYWDNGDFNNVMTSWPLSCFLLLGHTHGGYHRNNNVRR